MKDKSNKFEQMVRQEVQDFSSRPSDGFWMNLSGRLDTELGPPDTGTPAPPDGTGLPGTGLEHWLLQTLNINLITMITVGSLTLTVGILFFANSTGQSAAQASSTTPSVEQSEPATPQNLSEIATITPQKPLPDPIPSQKKTITIPIPVADSSEKIEPDQAKSMAPLPNLEVTEPEPLAQDSVDDQKDPVFQFSAPCEELVKLGDQIKNFRSKLERQLVKDGEINSSDYKIAIFYTPEKISLNNERLPEDKQIAYSALFQSFGIEACDNRLIQITPDYIAVGNNTSEGFKGQVNGSVDLRELNVHSELLGIKGDGMITDSSKPGKDQVLVLKNTDSRPDFNRMLEKLKEYGFKVKSSSYNQNDGLINAIKIHLTHPKGLDWSMRTRNFDRLEFRVSLDKSGKAKGFQYQFNEEAFKKVGLTTKGNISHTY